MYKVPNFVCTSITENLHVCVCVCRYVCMYVHMLMGDVYRASTCVPSFINMTFVISYIFKWITAQGEFYEHANCDDVTIIEHNVNKDIAHYMESKLEHHTDMMTTTATMMRETNNISKHDIMLAPLNDGDVLSLSTTSSTSS